QTGRLGVSVGHVKIRERPAFIRREVGYGEYALIGMIELPWRAILRVDEQLPSPFLLLGAIFYDGIHVQLLRRRYHDRRDERRPDNLNFPATAREKYLANSDQGDT